jgi:hypothetical protein
MNDEKHFWRLLAFDMLKKTSVKRPVFLCVGCDRQQAFRLVNHHDVFVLKNDLDAAAGRRLLMASCGPSSGVQEFTCALAVRNGRGSEATPVQLSSTLRTLRERKPGVNGF